MRMFRLLFGLDVLLALLAVYLFVAGLLDGGSSVAGMLGRAGVLAVPAVVLGGAWALRRAGRLGLANLVLALLAMPAGMVGSMIVMLVVLQVKWR